MSNNKTLDLLVDYFSSYTQQYQPDTQRYEIEEFLDDWLVRIQAPKDIRGIMIVLRSIDKFADDGSLKYRLQKIFHFPDWFFPALKFSPRINDKDALRLANNQHRGAGWCESNPFYVWLFRARNYSQTKNSRLFQLLFIEQYYARLTMLQDDELSTPSRTTDPHHVKM